MNNANTNNEIKTFHIFRHLNSCNNLYKINIFKNTNDPLLSLWGTITGLSIDKNIDGNFKGCVYVSCLLRTWITAIIKFLPHIKSADNFVLVVSPYIKEKHNKRFDLGNLPISFNKQVKKLQKYFSFLIILDTFLNHNLSENLKTNKYIITIKANLRKILNYKKNIIIQFPLQTGVEIYKFSIDQLKNNISSKMSNAISKFQPYSQKITTNLTYSNSKIYKMTGGSKINNFNKIHNYFNNIINVFIEQKNKSRIIKTHKNKNENMKLLNLNLKIEKKIKNK